jgi:hypothetical protein
VDNMGKTEAGSIRAHKDPASRLQQLGGLALDEIERRVLDHTATSQELTTLAKLGSEKALLENEKLRRENELLRAKTEAIESAKKVEEIYSEAVRMMGIYRGESDE